MKEQFDKRLVDKIKVSFQQHSEPMDPLELDKFKKLYFGQKNKGIKSIGAFWWMGIAASLVVGVLLFNLLQVTKINQDEDSVELMTSNNAIKIEEQSTTQILAEIEGKGPDNYSGKEKSHTKNEIQKSENQRSAKNEIDKIDFKVVQSEIDVLSPSKSTVAENNESLIEIKKDTNLMEPFIDASKSLTFEQDSKTEEKTLDYIRNWLGEEPEIGEKQTLAKIEKKSDPVKLGLLVAPQTITNATQSLSLGAGMMSEFSFSKRLKLDVGLAYARQQITPTSSGRNMMISSNGSFANTLDAAAPAEASRSAFSGNFINSTTELSFGQLEIPINLKYKVLENKNSDIYFISGFSNMMYLNQQNTTTFSTANLNQGNFVGMQSAIQTYTQTESPSSGTGNVDSGQMLNFGFGFEQNLKNGTFLSIEPFYKFSLGDQTFNNQQFSIGGINLRMNFQLKNKN